MEGLPSALVHKTSEILEKRIKPLTSLRYTRQILNLMGIFSHSTKKMTKDSFPVINNNCYHRSHPSLKHT